MLTASATVFAAETSDSHSFPGNIPSIIAALTARSSEIGRCLATSRRRRVRLIVRINKVRTPSLPMAQVQMGDGQQSPNFCEDDSRRLCWPALRYVRFGVEINASAMNGTGAELNGGSWPIPKRRRGIFYLNKQTFSNFRPQWGFRPTRHNPVCKELRESDAPGPIADLGFVAI
jgi:hypothetical protein